MEMGHDWHLDIVVNGRICAIHRRPYARLLIHLGDITILTIEDSHLPSEIGHIAEHLEVFGEEETEIDRSEKPSLILARVEHHPIE